MHRPRRITDQMQKQRGVSHYLQSQILLLLRATHHILLDHTQRGFSVLPETGSAAYRKAGPLQRTTAPSRWLARRPSSPSRGQRPLARCGLPLGRTATLSSPSKAPCSLTPNWRAPASQWQAPYPLHIHPYPDCPAMGGTLGAQARHGSLQASTLHQ